MAKNPSMTWITFAWILVLLLAYHNSNVECGDSAYPIRKFGCEFNKEYGVASIFTRTEILYGDFRNINTLKFYSFDVVYAVYDAMEKLYADFIAEQVYDNLNLVFDLHRSTTSCMKNKKSFDSCYDGYYPSYDSSHESSRLAIDWLELLSQKWPEFKADVINYDKDLSNFVYLAATDLGTWDTATWNMFTWSRVKAPSHVAAFIRFQVRGEFGYFLFDPGFALNKPLILMIKSIDDTMGIGVKRYKASTTVYRDVGDTISCKFDNPKIYCELVSNQFDTWPWYKKWYQNSYNVAEPYCSFLRSTIKPSVFYPRRKIVRRDREGKVLAVLSTMLYNTSNATINLAYYNKTIEGDIVNVLVIPVDNAVMIPGHDALSCIEKKEHQEHLEKVSSLLKMSQQTLKETISNLYNVFNDPTFLANTDIKRNNLGQFDIPGELWDYASNRVLNTPKNTVNLIRC